MASPRSSRLLSTVSGIVAGVLLVATGLALLQLLGALAIGLTLLMARAGSRLSEAWWSDPRGQLATTMPSVRRLVPSWTWPATVLAVVVVAAVFMVQRLMVNEGIALGTLGNLGKGAIALVMMASLALWSQGSLPRRFHRSTRGS